MNSRPTNPVPDKAHEQAAEHVAGAHHLLKTLRDKLAMDKHPELEEASRILGASRLKSLWDITAPLLRTSLVATWCFVFIGVIRELSATIMLTTANTKVIAVIIYDLNESGDLGAISVLGITLLLITFAVVLLANRLPVLGRAPAPRIG